MQIFCTINRKKTRTIPCVCKIFCGIPKYAMHLGRPTHKIIDLRMWEINWNGIILNPHCTLLKQFDICRSLNTWSKKRRTSFFFGFFDYWPHLFKLRDLIFFKSFFERIDSVFSTSKHVRREKTLEINIIAVLLKYNNTCN